MNKYKYKYDIKVKDALGKLKSKIAVFDDKARDLSIFDHVREFLKDVKYDDVIDVSVSYEAPNWELGVADCDQYLEYSHFGVYGNDIIEYFKSIDK
jgi:predicted phosphatase